MVRSDSDLTKLIVNLPLFLQNCIAKQNSNVELLEIILDLGKRPEARFIDGSYYLSQKPISWQDIEYMTKKISKFNTDNRAGIDRTLHRISCIRNRQFLINGLTCRIGRSVFGTISVINDLLETNISILILGKPGVGKTTVIREMARVLADEIGKRVIIIDTSNEVAGDSDIPHSGIGRARRMEVSQAELQHQVMIEAIENHMPEVIVIDEIGTSLEVLAAQTIAEKGIQLVGTTHGICLQNLINNPLLVNLIGGIQYVTLSDEESKRRRTQKSIIERKSEPTFPIIIELHKPNLWIVHENTKIAIDFILQNRFQSLQIRKSSLGENINIKTKRFYHTSKFFLSSQKNFISPLTLTSRNWIGLNKLEQFSKVEDTKRTRKLNIYSYSISNNLLKEILLKLNITFEFTTNLQKANLIIGLKKHLRLNSKLKKIAIQKNIPVYTMNHVSIYQLAKLFYLI